MKLASALAVLVALVACGMVRGATPVETIDERTTMASPQYVPQPPDQSDVVLPSDGTTVVTVAGIARMRATSAMLRIEFTSRDAGSTSRREITVADAQPIVDVLVKSGIPQSAIAEFERWSPPNHDGAIAGTVSISAPLTNTDPAAIRALALRINAAEGYPAYHSFSSVDFHVDDCATLIQRARKAALDQARTQAQSGLQGTNQRLGPIRSIQERSASISEGGCGTNLKGNDVPVGRNGNFEAANGGNVVATVQLAVGFEILQ